MKSDGWSGRRGSNCLTWGAWGRGVATLAAFGLSLQAQQTPGSIVTTAQPLFGQVVFDGAGNIYYAEASGTPTAGALQTQGGGGNCPSVTPFFSFLGPCSDAYVGKVDAAGNLVWGTLLGGPTADLGTAMALDRTGNVLLVGSTGGSFPTTADAAIPTSTTAVAFAAKISSDGSRLLYSTYLPDTVATASAIATDAQGNAYIAGKTTAGHAYAMKLNDDGSTVLYRTVLGGSKADAATAILADDAGNVWVAGETGSPDFPVTPGAAQSRLAGLRNAFIAKLDTNGQTVFATYLGGSSTEAPAALKTDAAGNIYVAGQTTSLDFPTTAGSFEPVAVIPLWNSEFPAGFAAKLTPSGSALVWSTNVMSLDRDLQRGVVQLDVTPAGETYLAGITGAGFPVTGSAPQVCFGGSYGNTNAFLAHLDSRGALADATYVGDNVNGAYGLSAAADGTVTLVWHSTAENTKSEIRFGKGGWTPPACVSTGVENSATMAGGSVVAPAEFVTLTGFGMGPDIGAVYQLDAQGQVPRQLAGVQVFFDGQAAPVLYAQSRQINAQAPVELLGKTQTTVSVVYNGTPLGQSTVAVGYNSPGIFRYQPGSSSQAAAINQDGTVNGPGNAAARGSTVTLWGTGFGVTDPACPTGGLNADHAVNLGGGVSVDIFDGRYVPADYSGSAPALLCGVVQINVKVPSDVGAGTYAFQPASVVAGAGGSISSIGSTIVLK